MADLIDRQAALDAIMGQPPEPHYPSWYAAQIEELPATQPDHVADIGKKAEGDCISRQAAIDALARMMPRSYTPDGSHPADEEIYKAQEIYVDCIESIEILPAVQPERKKGEWLRYGEDGYPNNEDTVFWQCDQCLEQYTGRTKRIPNFCPNCGADMRTKEGDA